MLGMSLAAALAAQAAPAAAAPAPQQPPEAPASLWRPADDHFTFTTANIDVPRATGAVHFTRSFEFSHQAQGVDSGLEYESADRQIFATVYVYLPSLADAALTAFTTDWVIHLQSEQVHLLGTQVAAAGGHAGVAIRADYGGFRGNLASSAAFIKLNRWIIKVRVSGPEGRRQEVEATMNALLAGLHFNGPSQPRPARMFELTDCGDTPTVAARPVIEDESHLLMTSLIAVMDGAGEDAAERDGRHVDAEPSRIGARWCQPITIRIGETSRRILRAAPDASRLSDATRRSVLLAPMNDAGGALEEVQNGPHSFVLLFHDIGRTVVLGSYDAPLTDTQIADIESGADREGGRIRASVDHLANGDNHLNLVMDRNSAGGQHN